jgi:hypothetical protein
MVAGPVGIPGCLFLGESSHPRKKREIVDTHAELDRLDGGGLSPTRHRFDAESFRSFAAKRGAEGLVCHEGSRQAIAVSSRE